MLLVIFYVALAVGEGRYWLFERPHYPSLAMLTEPWPPVGYLVDAAAMPGRGMDAFPPGTTVGEAVRQYGVALRPYGSLHSLPPTGVLIRSDGGWTVRPMSQKERFIWRLPMNVNACSADDLGSIPSIGPALAARIHGFVRKQGFIRSVTELGQVDGIGEVRLAALRKYLTVK